METQRHHIVQKKYLTQWRKAESENQLNIFSITENKYIERGPDWVGFWRKNYNILDEEDQYFLPEKITAEIDTLGIKVIKEIDCSSQKQLDGYKRSVLAFYVALQYFRTPRFREETDKFFEQVIIKQMREAFSSTEKFRINKEDLLKIDPKNENDKKAIEKIKEMTEEEINQQSFDLLHSDNLKFKLTNTGHSKQILKINKYAKQIFGLQWLFLISPKDTAFATSDNPCFTFSKSKFSQGILSPNVIIFFPLRPDLCIAIKPSIKSKNEHYLKLDKKEVRDINKLILENSYRLFIAKDRKQLDYITKNYDYENHRQSRDTVMYKNDKYIMFNLE